MKCRECPHAYPVYISCMGIWSIVFVLYGERAEQLFWCEKHKKVVVESMGCEEGVQEGG